MGWEQRKSSLFFPLHKPKSKWEQSLIRWTNSWHLSWAMHWSRYWGYSSEQFRNSHYPPGHCSSGEIDKPINKWRWNWMHLALLGNEKQQRQARGNANEEGVWREVILDWGIHLERLWRVYVSVCICMCVYVCYMCGCVYMSVSICEYVHTRTQGMLMMSRFYVWLL